MTGNTSSGGQNHRGLGNLHPCTVGDILKSRKRGVRQRRMEMAWKEEALSPVSDLLSRWHGNLAIPVVHTFWHLEQRSWEYMIKPDQENMQRIWGRNLNQNCTVLRKGESCSKCARQQRLRLRKPWTSGRNGQGGSLRSTSATKLVKTKSASKTLWGASRLTVSVHNQMPETPSRGLTWEGPSTDWVSNCSFISQRRA